MTCWKQLDFKSNQSCFASQFKASTFIEASQVTSHFHRGKIWASQVTSQFHVFASQFESL